VGTSLRLFDLTQLGSIRDKPGADFGSRYLWKQWSDRVAVKTDAFRIESSGSMENTGIVRKEVAGVSIGQSAYTIRWIRRAKRGKTTKSRAVSRRGRSGARRTIDACIPTKSTLADSFLTLSKCWDYSFLGSVLPQQRMEIAAMHYQWEEARRLGSHKSGTANWIPYQFAIA